MKQRMWKDEVTVVFQDMRTWQAPEQADILVSELLGSFGDNELSPECLDGAQKFLKRTKLRWHPVYISPSLHGAHGCGCPALRVQVMAESAFQANRDHIWLPYPQARSGLSSRVRTNASRWRHHTS